MSEKKLQCQLCQKRVANTANVLARHVRSVHDTEWVEYVVKFEFGGQNPACACGCGGDLKWKKGGFGKYLKGHDNQGSQNSRKTLLFDKPGWLFNPFTGAEEHISLEDEVALLEFCVNNNDPVTHNHGIRIGWEDSTGKLRIVVPAFKHLQKRLIMAIDDIAEPGYQSRIKGYRTWCDEHDFILLILKRDADGFSVIDAYRRKIKDHETTK